MRRWARLVTLALALAALAARAAHAGSVLLPEETIVELGDTTFEAAVIGFPASLVLFYAPWCIHSRRLEEQLEVVSQTLENRAMVFKVDVTVHLELASRFRGDGTPSLLLFQRTEQFRGNKVDYHEYAGPRESAKIVDWVLAKSRQWLVEAASEKEVSDLVATRDSTLPYFVIRADDASVPMFRHLADSQRNLGAFIYRNQSKALPTIQVHRGFFEEDTVELYIPEGSEASSIAQLLRREQLPPFWVVTDDNFAEYMRRATYGMLWVLFPPDSFMEDAAAARDIFREAARTFVQFPVAFLDTAAHGDHARRALGCKRLPALAMQLGDLANASGPEPETYLLPLEGRLNSSADVSTSFHFVADWIREVLAGRVSAQPTPPAS